MKRSDRDKYLGKATFAVPSHWDVTVEGKRPRVRTPARAANLSASLEAAAGSISGALDANLPVQESLFGDFPCDVRHTLGKKMSQKQQNCD